jgi:uncharacterized protein YjfI (DUF2170 family)
MFKKIKLKLYGILPPNINKEGEALLMEACEEAVFKNVNEYCEFMLKNENN